jgi:rare lipoprotein A
MQTLRSFFNAATLTSIFLVGALGINAIADTTHKGHASWYGPGFHGRTTASGARFDQNAMTAAHRSLPFGTKVKVTNSHNGRSTVVTINDRGPYHRSRIIDLSRGAASAIGMIGSGVAPVVLDVL